MSKIAIIAASCKPTHAGHDMLFRKAAQECDKVLLFVSVNDRIRPGEFPIYGTDMYHVWKKWYECSLPSNIIVNYCSTTTPVRRVYECFDERIRAELMLWQGSNDTFVIYSDPVDLERNFSDASIKKYASFLYDAGRVQKVAVDRAETVAVSGTHMRALIASGDVEEFSRLLPFALRSHAQQMISLFHESNILRSHNQVPVRSKKRLVERRRLS